MRRVLTSLWISFSFVLVLIPTICCYLFFLVQFLFLVPFYPPHSLWCSFSLPIHCSVSRSRFRSRYLSRFVLFLCICLFPVSEFSMEWGKILTFLFPSPISVNLSLHPSPVSRMSRSCRIVLTLLSMEQ